MFNLAGGGGNVQGYNADFTWVAFFCCLIAASGGALFGYDNGGGHFCILTEVCHRMPQ